MQFDEVLAAFVDAFNRDGVDYAITGDLALHLSGYPRARPRLEFVGSPAAQETALALGFFAVRASERVTVFARDEIRVAILSADTREALPAFVDGRMVLVLDPARGLALTEEDLAVLEEATIELAPDAVGPWLNFMSAIAPEPRGNRPSDAPFEL